VPRPAYQALREIAFKEDRKVHDVVLEGIDAALAARGHPTIAKLRAAEAEQVAARPDGDLFRAGSAKVS
jgi:hypothetical protein